MNSVLSNVAAISIMFVFSTCSYANWTQIGSDNGAKISIDPTKIDSVGKYKETWVLSDTDSTQFFNGKRYNSLVSKEQYDCSNQTFKQIGFVMLSGHGGSGDVVDQGGFGSSGKWLPVSQSEITQTKFNKICTSSSVAATPKDADCFKDAYLYSYAVTAAAECDQSMMSSRGMAVLKKYVKNCPKTERVVNESKKGIDSFYQIVSKNGKQQACSTARNMLTEMGKE